ncbi:hypothetical protein LSTR_LSTR006490, partial [Laodelphax striatellus]
WGYHNDEKWQDWIPKISPNHSTRESDILFILSSREPTNRYPLLPILIHRLLKHECCTSPLNIKSNLTMKKSSISSANTQLLRESIDR